MPAILHDVSVSPQESLLERDVASEQSGRSDRNPMENLSDSRTQRTLLERLAQSGGQNQAAWSEFVDRYGRKIYGWCLRWRLQDADAQDVTQIVLLKLARRMKDFTYDPGRSFRAWLKTVTHHAWQDYRRRPADGHAGAGGDQARSAWTRSRRATTCPASWRGSSTWNCWRRRCSGSGCARPRTPGWPSR